MATGRLKVESFCDRQSRDCYDQMVLSVDLDAFNVESGGQWDLRIGNGQNVMSECTSI